MIKSYAESDRNMTGREKRILMELPSQELDAAVIEKFGAKTKCETIYELFGDMKHHTYFKDNGKNKKEIKAFIDGFSKGVLALRERLQNK